MGIKHYQEKNARAMEKELAQSDIPVKRKIQKTIRKYHISGKTTNTQPQRATCVSSSCYVGQTAMWQHFRSAGYARCCDNQKFYDRTHSHRWMSKGKCTIDKEYKTTCVDLRHVRLWGAPDQANWNGFTLLPSLLWYQILWQLLQLALSLWQRAERSRRVAHKP